MTERKEASSYTQAKNEDFGRLPDLDWDDESDFEAANRGFIARSTGLVENAKGRAVWDLTAYDFLANENAPSSVNPSLWRQARLNMVHGLFQIHDRIYQVRGHDLSVISFVVSDSGYIVIDPLISAECARSARELVYEHVGRRPVVAVIYTHCHVDHYGGVEGVVERRDVEAGKVRILAPEGFTENAIAENVIAGNAMGRRATYMYGGLLPKDEKGQVDASLGKATSRGSVSLIEPTETISVTGTTKTVDGVEIVFQVTPHTEAPAEMNFHFPRWRMLCMAENCSHNMHNLYTLRGAQVRDAKAWAHYINEALDLFVDHSDVVFTSHHWPVWGQAQARRYLTKQRDMYKFLHDQTLRLANHGLTPLEIADTLELPPSLAKEWYNRGYYGSVSHNSRAVYQRYLGFFDGHPARLDPLPPEQAGRRYVDLAGGPDRLLEHAREAFERGEYRWVAQVVDHLVFADPANAEARDLEADALEQLGYQSENATWRNFFLTGAQELRAWQPTDGTTRGTAAGGGMLASAGLEYLFDYLGIRLDGPAAEGQAITLNIELSDTAEHAVVVVENCVLNGYTDRLDPHADATLRTDRPTLNRIALGSATLEETIVAGEASVDGDAEKATKLFSLLDTFDRWFPIVTP